MGRHLLGGGSLVQAAKEMGLHHAMVGATLATHWTFPQAIRQAIAKHHDMECRGRYPIVMGVHLANNMSHALQHVQCDDERL